MVVEHVGIHENLKTGLWPECASTTTKLENIVVNPHEEKCAHENFYGKIPDYTKYSRTLGEMGVVRSIATIKAKMVCLGKTYMFLGYVKHHLGGTYCILNICTKRIILIHDVIWLNKTYG